jgi:hypothetical protein
MKIHIPQNVILSVPVIAFSLTSNPPVVESRSRRRYSMEPDSLDASWRDTPIRNVLFVSSLETSVSFDLICPREADPVVSSENLQLKIPE